MTTERGVTGCEARPVLIAAVSGRALAAAARRAGERVIVLDQFADHDTRRIALACQRLPKGRHGFARRPFLAALREWRDQVHGLVYGTGFERDPSLLAAAAQVMPILGNRPDVVATVKDPFRFASLLARLGLPHPPVRRDASGDPGWLRKTIGGSGGTHVAWAAHGQPRADTYVQKAVSGRSVSATFVADGRTARVLAFTEQWISGSAETPFRFGGVAGPLPLPPRLAARIAAACRAIAEAAQLVGLNSLDMLIDGDEFHILEVNPRPGASLDVLDGLAGQSLWQAHRAAVTGRLPSPRRSHGRARGAQIVYALHQLVVPSAFAWPAWSADRGAPGTVIRRGEPVCTVLATGATMAQARERVHDRSIRLLDRLTVRPSSPTTGVPHAEEAALA